MVLIEGIGIESRFMTGDGENGRGRNSIEDAVPVVNDSFDCTISLTPCCFSWRAVKAIVDYWHGILNRVPSSTILAVASHESGFNPNAFNQDHWGLMQVSPGTANDVAKDLTATGNPLIIQTLKRYDLSNPHTLLDRT